MVLLVYKFNSNSSARCYIMKNDVIITNHGLKSSASSEGGFLVDLAVVVALKFVLLEQKWLFLKGLFLIIHCTFFCLYLNFALNY